MRAESIATLVRQIDEDIQKNKQGIEADITTYLDRHRDKVIVALARDGYVMIPTFAGDFKITEKDLVASAERAPQEGQSTMELAVA